MIKALLVLLSAIAFWIIVFIIVILYHKIGKHGIKKQNK